MGWILGLCVMASLGLPGLAGFWGEFPAILAAYNPMPGLPVETFRAYMVIAALGTVLAAGYLLWLLQRTAFGRPSDEFADEEIPDVTTTEWIAWTPLLILILVLGIYPRLVFETTDPAIVGVADRACISAADGDEEIAAGCVRPEAVTLAQEEGAAEATTARSRAKRTTATTRVRSSRRARPRRPGRGFRPAADRLACGRARTGAARGRRVLATLVDVWLLDRGRRFAPSIAGIGFLAALIPVITLAIEGQDRVMFGGA